MNERIEKLMLEAGYAAPELAGRANKLAELIVRECANVAADHDALDIYEEIREHFGIEESKGWVCPKCGTDRTKEACPQGYMAAVEGKCPMILEAQ